MKRCKSAAPGLGWRCEKRRGHAEGDRPTFHRAAFQTWGPTEGSTWTGPQQGHAATFATIDELHPDRWAGVARDFAPVAPPTAEQELAAWWRNKSEAEIDQTVAKAIEYGSTDLIDIGHDLARVAGRALDEQEAAEWGIYFYILGKLSRWRSAMERGDRVSDDTLLDIGVYVRMAQRVREAGGWPGIKEETA